LDDNPRQRVLLDDKAFVSFSRFASSTCQRDELVAAAGYRNEIPRLTLALAQRFAEGGYVNGQVSFLDELIGPNALQQLLFRHDPAAILNQRDEQIESLRIQ
jgi:hypothetical protein